MSTILFSGRSGLMGLVDNSVPSDPLPQINQAVAVVKGSTVLTFGPMIACGLWALSDGVTQFLNNPDGGRGIQAATSCTGSLAEPTFLQRWAPTQQRGQNDVAVPTAPTGNPASDSNTSVNLARAISLAGDRAVFWSKGAYWLRPRQELPGSPGFPALNRRWLSEQLTKYDVQIGVLGNDRIISWDVTILLPVDPILQSLADWCYSPLSVYSPNPSGAPVFSNIWECDPNTGNITAAVSLQSSSTKCYILANAAGTAAIAAYTPLANVVAPGFNQCFAGTGTGTSGFTNSFCLPRENSAPQPGFRRYSCYIPFDTLTNVRASLVTLRSNFG